MSKKKENVTDINKKVKYRFLWSTNAWTVGINYYLNEYITIKHINDYYNTLPPFIFQCDWNNSIRKYENKLIPQNFYTDKIIQQDIKNGYIRAYCEKNEAEKVFEIEIALFTSSTNNFLVLNYLHEGGNTILRFLGKTPSFIDENDLADTWQNIIGDDNIFPNLDSLPNAKSNQNWYYKLPEKGTQILACQDSSETLANPDEFWKNKVKYHPHEITYINWENGKFVIKPTKKENDLGLIQDATYFEKATFEPYDYPSNQYLPLRAHTIAHSPVTHAQKQYSLQEPLQAYYSLPPSLLFGENSHFMNEKSETIIPAFFYPNIIQQKQENYLKVNTSFQKSSNTHKTLLEIFLWQENLLLVNNWYDKATFLAYEEKEDAYHFKDITPSILPKEITAAYKFEDYFLKFNLAEKLATAYKKEPTSIAYFENLTHAKPTTILFQLTWDKEQNKFFEV